MDKRRVLAAVACLALVTLVVSASLGSVAADNNTEGFDLGYTGTIHGFDAGTFVSLWGDATSSEWVQYISNTTTERARVGEEGASPSTVKTFVARSETSATPGDLPQKWNSEVLASAEVIEDAEYHDTSVYPESVDPVDRPMIKDAHATIFSVGPSTTVHDGEIPTRYIAESGTIRSLTDFRPEEPEYDPGFEDDNVVTDVDVTSTRKGAPINETRLIVDGEVIDTAENTRTAELQYDEIDPDTEELTVESELHTEYEVRVETTTERTYDLGAVNPAKIGSIEIDELTDLQNFVDARESADEDYGKTIGVSIIDVTSDFDIFSLSNPGSSIENVQAQGAAGATHLTGANRRDESLGGEPIRECIPGAPADMNGCGSDGGGGSDSGSGTGDDGQGEDDGSGSDNDESDGDDDDDDAFVDLGSVTVQYTAVTFETVENTETVRDTVDVEVYDPEKPDVVIGTASDGADYVQVRSEDPIAGYTVEDARSGEEQRVRYGWDFYTARDTEWDNTTISTDTEDTTVRSVLNPVQTHAASADTSSVKPDNAVVDEPDVEYDERGDRSDDPHPPGVGAGVTTYRVPEKAVTPHTTDVDGGVTINGIVPGTEMEISSDEVSEVEIRPVTIETEESDTETGPVVEVTIKDGRTGEPIPGSELAGAVYGLSGVREKSIEISEDGTGEYEMETYGNGEIRYEPAPWGEAETPRSSARETFAISQFTEGDAFVRLIEETIYYIVIPLLIVRKVASILRGWRPAIE
jgi:hypothetical protein